MTKNNNIVIYQSEDGNVHLDVYIMMRLCGSLNSRCPIYIKRRVQTLWSISSTSMRMVN